jgi:hypothetical protein
MSQDDLAPLLTFPFEVPLHQQLFDSTPLRIIEMYLQCFDEDGVQRFGVPKHVLEALAVRFQTLMRKQHNTLDSAFGGRVARQRNKLFLDKRDYGIIFNHMGARERARERARKSRKYERSGTPTEEADEEMAERQGMSVDNVRRIYRKSKHA